MEITKDILYVGVNDHLVDLFEGQYDVPNGMAYNSYLICDDKVAVMDSVDAHFTDEWITKIAAALGERTPDYLSCSTWSLTIPAPSPRSRRRTPARPSSRPPRRST